jgi:hypothetical protein
MIGLYLFFGMFVFGIGFTQLDKNEKKKLDILSLLVCIIFWPAIAGCIVAEKPND